jgi:hypothetical protein
MIPQEIAEQIAAAAVALEWTVANAANATLPVPMIARTPDQRAALIAGALDDIEKHPVSDADTLEQLDADLRVALARRIARAVMP